MGLDFLAQIDPSRLTPDDWKTTSEILHYLWYVLLTVIAFASLLLFAHAVLPSAIASGHVPAGLREPLRRVRFPLYVASVLLLILVAYWFAQAIHFSYGIKSMYDRWWI